MLRALEARYGRLSLDGFHGLYQHSPALAVGFLLTGLASVGFPGTLGFVSTELLVDGAVEANLLVTCHHRDPRPHRPGSSLERSGGFHEQLSERDRDPPQREAPSSWGRWWPG